MTMRLSQSSFTGTERTLVAVGTVRLASMLDTVRAGAPLSPVYVGSSVASASAFFSGSLGVDLLLVDLLLVDLSFVDLSFVDLSFEDLSFEDLPLLDELPVSLLSDFFSAGFPDCFSGCSASDCLASVFADDLDVS